ncbi:hypothetical protein [Micromonospora haikouensis]|uniref:hypothetical protein n=1 Tax=Micromonospora haikouensis TaxID=686309 RepID=UPI003D704908
MAKQRRGDGHRRRAEPKRAPGKPAAGPPSAPGGTEAAAGQSGKAERPVHQRIMAAAGGVLVAVLTALLVAAATKAGEGIYQWVARWSDARPLLDVVEIGQQFSCTGCAGPWSTAGVLDAESARRVANQEELGRTLDGMDAAPVGRANVYVVLRNPHDFAVTVTGMRADVQQRSAPAAGTLLVQAPIGGGDPLPQAVQAIFDLDEPNAPPRRADPEGGPVLLPDSYLPIGPKEQIVLALRATTGRCRCEWTVVLETVGEKGREEIRIGDPRAPYTVTAPTARYGAGFEIDEGELLPLDLDRWCRKDCVPPLRELAAKSLM